MFLQCSKSVFQKFQNKITQRHAHRKCESNAMLHLPNLLNFAEQNFHFSKRELTFCSVHWIYPTSKSEHGKVFKYAFEKGHGDGRTPNRIHKGFFFSKNALKNLLGIEPRSIILLPSALLAEPQTVMRGIGVTLVSTQF